MVTDKDTICKVVNDQRGKPMTSRGTQKRRLFFLDIIRIACALLIYLRHSVTIYGCTYGHMFDVRFFQATSPVMTCFFMLAGFSIHYQHRQEEMNVLWTRTFLKKRLIGIMPSYLIVVAVWPLVHPDQINDWAMLLPIDVIGIQTSYRTLFGILHNGGTWFVSCMLLAYLMYPIIKAAISSGKLWVQMTVLIVIHSLLVYSYFVIDQFSLDTLYSNPIARTAEFAIGVVFAEIVFSDCDNEQAQRKQKVSLPSVISIVIMTVMSVIVYRLNQNDPNTMYYSYFVIPIILVAFLIGSVLQCQVLEKSKILSALSGMSYQFFLMQLFLWDLTSVVLGALNISGNVAKIVTSFVLCTVVSYTIYRFFDRPARKWLAKKLI